MCTTTLKRACRRHGIKRWPRRQIAKLSKALNEMGYQDPPPEALLESAIKGEFAGATRGLRRGVCLSSELASGWWAGWFAGAQPWGGGGSDGVVWSWRVSDAV